MNAHTKIQLLPDTEKLGRFCAAIFKRANPLGIVSLRAFPDAAKDAPPLFIDPISVGDPQFLAVVTERARQAANWDRPVVFCPPVVTFRTAKNAKKDNVLEGVALSVECDKTPNAALVFLKEVLGDPTVIVASGGEWENPETGEVERRVHIHWRLKIPTATPADHERLREARDLAAKLVGSDATAIALVHPLRWPGSWHCKKKPPRLTDIVFESENEIDLTEALALLRDATGSASFDGSPSIASDKTAGVTSTGLFAAAILRAGNVDDVVSALALTPNEKLEWSDWNYVGLATWGATGGSDEGFKAFADWSAKSSKNDPETTRLRWEHYKTSPPNRIGFGTLVYLARKQNPLWRTGTQSAEQSVDPVDLWAKFDPPTLPRGVLPDLIERFAFDQGMAMGCDMAGVAVSALAACAAAIPDKIELQVKRHNTGWLESARLWVALVGPPSSMKSPIMAAAVRPLRRIDTEMARRYAEERSRYDKRDRDEKAQTEPPKQTRLLLQDTTIEAAQEVLKDSPDGVLCFQDEMSGWFGSMEKYSGSRASAKDRAFRLEAFNGAPYTVNRVGRGSVFIEHLSVSLLGGIQPEPIRQIADDSVDDGLLQRILPIILGPAVEGRDEEASPVLSEYASLIGRLHRLSSVMCGGRLRFNDGAQAYRQELERKHLELCQSFETINRKLAAHIGKYIGMFARLCIIWHCVESQRGQLPALISEGTARRVVGFLHGFLLPHALAFYAGVLGLSNAHDRLTAVAGYILAHRLDRITNRDIQHGNRTMRGLDRREIESVFDQLEALGWIDRIPGPKPTAPPHCIVNPAVHVKFAARAAAEATRRARDRKMISEILGQRATPQ
jgi:hypothetical protein